LAQSGVTYAKLVRGDVRHISPGEPAAQIALTRKITAQVPPIFPDLRQNHQQDADDFAAPIFQGVIEDSSIANRQVLIDDFASNVIQ
jgi:hypothetical protein